MAGKTLLLRASLLAALLSCALPRAARVESGASRATPSAAQDWPWPNSLDAVVAAPENHQVLLENDRVRVLEVTIPPRAKEPLHAHRWPSVLYIGRAGAFRDYDRQGKVLFDSRQAKEPLKYPLTQWLEPQAPHAVENLSNQPIHLIRVELKK